MALPLNNSDKQWKAWVCSHKTWILLLNKHFRLCCHGLFCRSNNNNSNQHLIWCYWYFLFDATLLCWDISNCPQPGPSNGLLAATVLQFLRRNETNQASKIHVITQWEVVTALKQQYSARQKFNIIPVGTSGVFQNAADS